MDNLVNEYYELDPDEGSIFVAISNLNEEQKEYIAKNIFIEYDMDDIRDNDDTYDNGRTYKYYIDACLHNGIFDNLTKYLRDEGYKNVGTFWTQY
jgi:hypothetical protein